MTEYRLLGNRDSGIGEYGLGVVSSQLESRVRHQGVRGRTDEWRLSLTTRDYDPLLRPSGLAAVAEHIDSTRRSSGTDTTRGISE